MPCASLIKLSSMRTVVLAATETYFSEAANSLG
jgi:hypothetical protein